MLTPHNTEAIRKIEEAIGYTFNDKRLLVQALTRKTYLKIDPEAPDHEVLEFYGDTLMNYHVTNYFMYKYAHMLEDGLFFMRTVEQFTDMRSHYVCNRYLTDRVKALGLAKYLRAQNRDSELRRDGEKAYADIFESLVGAIYLDSYQNDTLIRAFILRQLGIEPKRLPAEIEVYDYDTLTAPIPVDEPLSEIEAVADPTADVAEPARPTADVSAATEEPVIDEPAEVMSSVTADVPVPPSLPVAETEAVTSEAEAVEVEKEVPSPLRERLDAFCDAEGYDRPVYGETPPNAPNARPVASCTLKYKDRSGKIVKISLNDSGKTLAEATEKAAAKMLRKLEKQAADASAAGKPADQANADKPAKKVSYKIADKAEDKPHVQEVQPRAEAVIVTETLPIEGTAPVEKAPVVETPVEIVLVEVTPVEVVPVVEAPVEVAPAEVAPVEEAPVEEAPVEVAPVEEAKPAKKKASKKVSDKTEAPKSPAKKKSAKSKATDPVAEVEPAVTEAPAEAVAEVATVTTIEPKAESVVEAVSEPVVEAVAEAAVAAPAEDQPAKEKKTPAPKKPSKKKTSKDAKTDATVEAIVPSAPAEAPAEAPAPEETAAKPEIEAKPRPKRSRAKKAAEADKA